MRHPTDGMLRRMLDEPDGVPVPDRDHVAECAPCAEALLVMREDAELVRAALATQEADDVDLDLDAAWRRLSGATPAARTPAFHRGRRVRSALRRPAVAGAAVAVVLASAGAAAANDWLPVFRTERVAPISLTADQLNAFPDLGAFGEVDVDEEPELHDAPDEAAAEAISGLDLPTVAALPRGVVDRPTFQVGEQVQGTFTFDADRAAEAVDGPLPAALERLDGTTVRLVAGPGAAELYPSASGAPALLVGRAVAPTASSSPAATFEELRDGLLSLPGIPAELASSLRTLNADGRTLPLPVPVDRFRTSSAEVDGRPATVLASKDGTLAGVVWVDDGVVTVVAGTLDVGEVLDVARGLR
jgi:hypothetical protein